MHSPSFVLGYHGCDEAIGEAILDGHKTRKYDTVRGAFLEGEDLYPGAQIKAGTHIQICVREPAKSIIGYFRVKEFPRKTAQLTAYAELQQQVAELTDIADRRGRIISAIQEKTAEIFAKWNNKSGTA